jgi:hypothetical protein
MARWSLSVNVSSLLYTCDIAPHNARLGQRFRRGNLVVNAAGNDTLRPAPLQCQLPELSAPGLASRRRQLCIVNMGKEDNAYDPLPLYRRDRLFVANSFHPTAHWLVFCLPSTLRFRHCRTSLPRNIDHTTSPKPLSENIRKSASAQTNPLHTIRF